MDHGVLQLWSRFGDCDQIHETYQAPWKEIVGDLTREAPWGQVGRAGVEWQTSVECPTNCRKATVWVGGWRKLPIAIKGFRFALGMLESCRRVCGGARLYDPGAELCRIGSGHGGKRARIGGTLKEVLVSSFLTSRSVRGAPVKASQASGGHSFPCARPHLLTTNKS